MYISDNQMIRRQNLDILRDALKTSGTVTKPQLASITGFSVVTVNSLIAELVEHNEVLESGIVQAQVGRPAKSYTFNARHRLSLILSLYEENSQGWFDLRICDLLGNCLLSEKHVLPHLMERSFDARISALLEDYPAISVIVFGVPGTVRDGCIVTNVYPELRNVDLKSYLESKFKLPILFENDTRSATIGYCHSHPEYFRKYFVGLYFPQRILPGASICINGEILRGKNNLAGEIAHLPIGIDWTKFERSPQSIKEYLNKLIQSFACMLNPDTIVIFTDKQTRDLLPDTWTHPESTDLVLPNVVFEDGFREIYARGLTHLATNYLKKSRTALPLEA